MPRAKAGGLAVASLRDFGGGWNVADAEYNLASRFLTVADNVTIGIDNGISPRAGNAYFLDFYDGTVYSSVEVTANVQTFTAGYIHLTITAHTYNSGDHITIDGMATIDGIPADELNAQHGVIKVNANTIRIQTRTSGTAGVTAARTYTHTRDTHTLGGNIIDCAFFQNYVIVFSNLGEVARGHYQTGVKTKIWNIALANATAGNPRGWGPCDHVSFDTWKQTLIVVNGRDNDKPIEIDNERTSLAPTQYLVDPASSSNTFVYSADFVLTHGSYLLLVGANNPNTPSTNTPTLVEVSAAGTSGVFTGNPAPDDATQIDLGQVTTTVDPHITGVSSIRDNVFVSLYDTAMLGTLGTYDSNGKHKPDFKDQLPQHGSLNHRVIKNIGNDLFMCDYAGVPAFTQSQMSNTIVPERYSQLIDPAMVKHFARLSDYTRRFRIWAIFNTRDRQYMIFAPKFDEASSFSGDDNGIYCVPDLSPFSLVLVAANNHTVSAGDLVSVSGAVDFTGLPASSVNGTRRVVAVINENNFIMEVGSVPTISGVSGGGTAIEFAPVNDEFIGYIFQYNPALKIRRWTRYRNLNFVAGTLSKDGTVYMCKDGRVFIWGTSDRNYTADDIGEWDYTWTPATNYIVGDRVKQSSSDNTIYECIVNNTSSGTFQTDVIESDNWQVYKGHPIEWVAETPWSDYGKRAYKKINKYIKCDTTGTAKFNVKTFVDNIYRDYYSDKYYNGNEIGYDVSVVDYSFIGRDAGGFGVGMQSYGLGMRTREQPNIEYPFECQLAKLRFSGTTTEPVKVIGVTLLYHLGSIYR